MVFFPKLPEIPTRTRKPASSREPHRPAPAPIVQSVEFGLFPNELGTPVVVPELVLVLDDLAIAIDQFRVYSKAVFADLTITSRDPMTGQPPWGTHTWNYQPDVGIFDDTELWRIGIELADGRRAFTPNIDSHNHFTVEVRGGGGDALLTRQTIYIATIPPDGQITISFDLGRHGCHETTTTIHGFSQAALNSNALWRPEHRKETP